MFFLLYSLRLPGYNEPLSLSLTKILTHKQRALQSSYTIQSVQFSYIHDINKNKYKKAR